jgi:hypothetical protein
LRNEEEREKGKGEEVDGTKREGDSESRSGTKSESEGEEKRWGKDKESKHDKAADHSHSANSAVFQRRNEEARGIGGRERK